MIRSGFAPDESPITNHESRPCSAEHGEQVVFLHHQVLDADGAQLSSLDVVLANGADILDTWLYVDLSGLGVVSGLGFSFASSDMGQWSINTPAYFAMDGLTTVPLPETLNTRSIA